MSSTSPPVLRTALVAAATAGATFAIAVAIAAAAHYRAPSLTADSGMMAGLVPLFWAFAGLAVMFGAVACAAIAGAAAAIGAALSRPWLAPAIVAGLSLLLGWALVALAATWQEGVVAAAFGSGSMLAGVLAGLLFGAVSARTRVESPPARAAPAQATARGSALALGERLDHRFDRWAGRADAATRWRAVRERRALLLLIFVGFGGFALFACLGIPDVAPWYYGLGYTGGGLNALLYYGSQPWLGLGAGVVPLEDHLGQAWITAIAFGIDATAIAALVFAALARRPH